MSDSYQTRDDNADAGGETSDVDANPAAAVAPPRLAHLVLNGAFLERHDTTQVQSYVDAVVAVSAHSDRDEDDIEADLRERMDAAGIALPDESYRNLARQLHDSAGVAVSTDDGRMLHGDPSLSIANHDPDVRGTDDPDDPDRPFYS